MNLQGRDLVSQATQRSARAMVATALAVLLAKFYAVPLEDLNILGVSIPLAAVRGAVVAVLVFQILNHLVHWWGDFQSGQAWNNRDRVNGIARFGVGARVLIKLDAALELHEQMAEQLKAELPANRPEAALREVQHVREALEEVRASALRFRSFGAFYFFGWYLALPVGVAFAALFLPGLGG